MSKPSAKITRTIRSEQVLNAFVEVVRISYYQLRSFTYLATPGIVASLFPGSFRSILLVTFQISHKITHIQSKHIRYKENINSCFYCKPLLPLVLTFVSQLLGSQYGFIRYFG